MQQYTRFNVVGSSGSGKSTIARAIAQALQIPYVELDALFWKRGWQESPDDELLQSPSQVRLFLKDLASWPTTE